MSEFVKRIENRQPPDGLKGLIIRREKIVIQDPEPSRVQNLDSLPFSNLPRYLNLDQYRRFGSPLLVQTKRGCTFKCSYCTYNQIEGKEYRLRNPALIADEIEILVKQTGISHIEFADSIFNVPLSHAKSVLHAVISKNLDLKLHTMGLTPSAVDEELLDLMKRAGFNEVDIGVESLCDKILESLSKNFKLADVITTADLLKKKKIPATWFLILGSPLETRETVLESLNSLGKIISEWDLVFVSTGVRVYNGSPYANDMIRKDIHCTDDNFLLPVKIEPENISLEEIHTIAKQFSFSHPNFYFYEKEHIIPGWLLMTGTLLLRMFHSRQPVWQFLILLKKIELVIGISFAKKVIYNLKINLSENKSRKSTGFSLIEYK
jgi:hypothetical protein